MLDRLRHAPNKDVRIGDLRKSHVVELCRRKPRRGGRLEDGGAVPGAFEGLADPDIVLRRLQPGHEYPVGTKTQEMFGALQCGIESFRAIGIRAADDDKIGILSRGHSGFELLLHHLQRNDAAG